MYGSSDLLPSDWMISKKYAWKIFLVQSHLQGWWFLVCFIYIFRSRIWVPPSPRWDLDWGTPSLQTGPGPPPPPPTPLPGYETPWTGYAVGGPSLAVTRVGLSCLESIYVFTCWKELKVKHVTKYILFRNITLPVFVGPSL